MEVIRADLNCLDELAKLFDQYRIFYQQSSNLQGSMDFMKSRFAKGDSVIYVAKENSRLIGFSQLYPSFSSVGMQRIWILNDLFVEEGSRKQNVAKYLMEAAKKHGQSSNALRIELATQVSNSPAQCLYESQGYVKNEKFYHYALTL